jgi:condensin complex subunit 3
LGSKEKTVRYRSTQLVAHVINSLDSIDDEYYHLLKMGLLNRIRDKEPMIRVQAVLGLGRLAWNEDDGDQENENSDDDDVSGLLERLLDALQNDPSADVRRSLLLNLPLTASTLPYLLERARDLDAATRRALYSRLLPALGDFRHLSLSMREKLLRWGLRDRDENVRKATARLFRERWIEDCAGARANGESGALSEAAPPSIDGLLELLERIDVVNSGVEEGIASGAMHDFWDGRLDYVEAVSFADPFWDHLSPESAFMARSFNDYCHQQANDKYETLVEEKMPEVTKHAFFLQSYTNNLVDSLCRKSEKHERDEEEDTVEQEFIVEQLLHIAKTLDYSDEVGRRKMFALLRETLSISELPDEITKLVVDVLRDVCGAEAAGEREFCGVVLEAIAEVHDAITVDEPAPNNEDESFHSARSEISDTTPTRAKGSRNIAGDEEEEEEDGAKAIREITINMKCLHIAQCMLQNVEVNLQQNVHLVTMLNNLIVPAVRSHEAPIRERGLLCLGLCCLLDKVYSSRAQNSPVFC